MPKTYTPVLLLPRPGTGADLVSEGDDILRELTDRLDQVVGPPSGPAGGDLGGSYPNPQVVTINGKAVSAVVFNTDARLSDARTPTGTAGGELGGSYPNPTVAKVNGRNATSVVFTDDARLTDARAPLAPLVTALPATPYEGQEVVYKVVDPGGAQPNGGLHWRFRYSTTLPSVGLDSVWNPQGRKWVFMGGPPQFATRNSGSGAAINLPSGNVPAQLDSTGSANIYVPLAGDYVLEWGVAITQASGAANYGIVDASNLSATAINLGSFQNTRAITEEAFVMSTRLTTVAAGTTLTMVGWQAGGSPLSISTYRPWMRLTPLHVG